MRLLVIGDIHGCLTALNTLLDLVQPAPEDQLVTLGDYVDRGPDSRGVIERLIELYDTGRLVALRGNHDEMMMDARHGQPSMWLACGGKQTLASYGLPCLEADEMKKIPQRHWAFLDSDCRDWYETEQYIFVHGCLAPDLEMPEQPVDVLRWEKMYGPMRHRSGKTVVCGHTRQLKGEPRRVNRTIWLDTGVYESAGWLTCLDALSGQYSQANQRGQTRAGRLW
jgi:serine/threonine protein phosphatase 1